MKKVRLDLDDLQVESFSTTQPESKRGGTVRGYETVISCRAYTCGGACGTIDVGLCEFDTREETCGLGCGEPTDEGCIYPTAGCEPTETYGEYTCFCEYPNTDVRVCDSEDSFCSGGGGMC